MTSLLTFISTSIPNYLIFISLLVILYLQFTCIVGVIVYASKELMAHWVVTKSEMTKMDAKEAVDTKE